LIQFHSFSPEDTENLGYFIGRRIQVPAIIALQGDLAAGKTLFSRALCRAIGCEDDFSSPTYTIMNEYNTGSKKVYHLDVYRLESSEELDYIGFDTCLEEDALVLIEWADLVADALEDCLWITMEKTEEANTRIITLNFPNLPAYQVLEQEVKEFLS